MRTLVIENNAGDIEENEILQLILRKRFPTGHETWRNFKYAFNPIHTGATVDRFLGLEHGDNIILQDLINEPFEFDMFMTVLYMLRKEGKRINVYCLHEQFHNYIDRELSRDKHDKISIKCIQSLDYHNVIKLGVNPENDEPVTLPSKNIEIDPLAEFKNPEKVLGNSF